VTTNDKRRAVAQDLGAVAEGEELLIGPQVCGAQEHLDANRRLRWRFGQPCSKRSSPAAGQSRRVVAQPWDFAVIRPVLSAPRR